VEVSRVAKRDGHLVHLPITTVLRKLIVQVRQESANALIYILGMSPFDTHTR
jgi:hypothetical protein